MSSDAVRDRNLFAIIRAIAARPLTQKEVDQVNQALYSDIVSPPNRMRVSPVGIQMIHSFESLKLKAYPDPATKGKPYTIGWGAITDEQGRPINPGDTWTKERADARFAQYIAEMEVGMELLLAGKPTTQNQFDAMASFGFNLGLDIDNDDIAEGLGDSSLLKFHKAGQYEKAKKEFVKWNKAAGKVMAGLTRRREAEAALYGKP